MTDTPIGTAAIVSVTKWAPRMTIDVSARVAPDHTLRSGLLIQGERFSSDTASWVLVQDGTDASGMSWAQNIYNGLANANLSAFLYWWGSTTPSENGDNEGLVEINGSTVTPSLS